MMDIETTKYSDEILENEKEFLLFLKGKFALFHLSNVFFRDIHYGVWEYLERQRIKLRYEEAEKIAREVVRLFEAKRILKRLNGRTWLLNYPEFKLAPVKLVPALKPPGRAAAAA
jgi:hypothetical protein